MDEKTKDLLVRALDMNELELRAALICIINGDPIDKAIDAAYNEQKRFAQKLFRKEG